MDRRRFLLTSLAGALTVPLAAQAQQAGVMYRIGFLPFSVCSVPEAFRSALNRLSYVSHGLWCGAPSGQRHTTADPLPFVTFATSWSLLTASEHATISLPA